MPKHNVYILYMPQIYKTCIDFFLICRNKRIKQNKTNALTMALHTFNLIKKLKILFDLFSMVHCSNDSQDYKNS